MINLSKVMKCNSYKKSNRIMHAPETSQDFPGPPWDFLESSESSSSSNQAEIEPTRIEIKPNPNPNPNRIHIKIKILRNREILGNPRNPRTPRSPRRNPRRPRNPSLRSLVGPLLVPGPRPALPARGLPMARALPRKS